MNKLSLIPRHFPKLFHCMSLITYRKFNLLKLNKKKVINTY